MQLLRHVELNARQIINFRAALQAQLTRAIAGLGMNDVRELRGRYDCIEWQPLDERVRSRRSHRTEFTVSPSFQAERGQDPVPPLPSEKESLQAPSDCGVAAIVSNHFIPSHVMDLMLGRMANRGMDGLESGREGVIPSGLNHYALHVLVKGSSRTRSKQEHLSSNLGLYAGEIRPRVRKEVLTSDS